MNYLVANAIEARWLLETNRRLQPARADILALVAEVKALKFGLQVQARLADDPPNDEYEVARLRAHVEGLMA